VDDSTSSLSSIKAAGTSPKKMPGMNGKKDARHFMAFYKALLHKHFIFSIMTQH